MVVLAELDHLRHGGDLSARVIEPRQCDDPTISRVDPMEKSAQLSVIRDGLYIEDFQRIDQIFCRVDDDRLIVNRRIMKIIGRRMRNGERELEKANSADERSSEQRCVCNIFLHRFRPSIETEGFAVR